MTEEEAWQAAAATLGMSGERMEWLVEKLQPFRHADVVDLNAPITIYADPDGAAVWEVEVTGTMTVTEDGETLVAEFRLRNFIADREFWRGCCSVPDRYRITLDDEVVFDGEVQNPGDPNDDVGWERYQLFNPIRLEAWDNATAMVYTNRIEKRIVASSSQI
ncbi:MAG TPA: hypothetical protein VGH44_01665 [Candidatus Saccharimonadia bacterium]|jgi:hypothetical protein